MATAQLDLILNAQKYQRELVKTLGMTEKQAASQAMRMAREQKKAADKAATAQKQAADRSKKAWSGAFKAIGAAAVIAFATKAAGAIERFSKSVIDYRNLLNDASARTALTADTLQALQLAAEGSGQSFDQVVKSAERLPKLLADADNELVSVTRAFERIGVETHNADGRLRDADDVFRDIVKSIGSIQSPTERAAAAMDLFGRQGGKMVQALSGGAEHFAALEAIAKDFGVSTGPEAAAQAAQMQEEIARLGMVARGAADDLFNAFGGDDGMLGAIDSVSASIVWLSTFLDTFVNNVKFQFKELAAPFAALGEGEVSAIELAKAIGKIGLGLTGVGTGAASILATTEALEKADEATVKFMTHTDSANRTIGAQSEAMRALNAEFENQRNASAARKDQIVADEMEIQEITLQTDAMRIASAREVADAQVSLASSSAAAIGSIATSLAADNAQAQRRAWAVDKASAVASAALNTALAVSNAFADVPYPANIAAAIEAGIQGAAHFAAVASSPPPSFYSGGSMGSPYASPQGSVVPITVHPRELITIQNQTESRDSRRPRATVVETWIAGRRVADTVASEVRRGGTLTAEITRRTGRLGHLAYGV
jgi:hypothetical protein